MDMEKVTKKLRDYLKNREEVSKTWWKEDSDFFLSVIEKLEKGEELTQKEKWGLDNILEGWEEVVEEEIQEENGWELEEVDSPILEEIYSIRRFLGFI